jgi:mono/diheme cytochrome c family protein
MTAAGAAFAALVVIFPLAHSFARDSDLQDFTTIERGRKLATLADCVACHTRKDEGKPYAGGRPI